LYTTPGPGTDGVTSAWATRTEVEARRAVNANVANIVIDQILYGVDLVANWFLMVKRA